jgi:hypothetical protein
MGKGRLVVRLLEVLVETRMEMGAGRGEMLCPVRGVEEHHRS